MKKQILIILGTLTFSTNCFSQIPAKTISVGGDVNFSIDNYDDESGSSTWDRQNTRFSTSPSLEYFIKENMALGLVVGYTYSQTEDTREFLDATNIRTMESDFHQIRFGPTFRYFKMFTDNFGLFGRAQATIGFNNGETKTFDDGELDFNETREGNEYLVSLSPGLVFFPSRKIGLEARFGSLSYSYWDEERENEIDSSVTSNKRDFFDINLGLSSFFFGLRYYMFRD